MKTCSEAFGKESSSLAVVRGLLALGVIRTLCVNARTLWATGHTAILSLIIACSTAVALAIASSLIRCVLFLILYDF